MTPSTVMLRDGHYHSIGCSRVAVHKKSGCLYLFKSQNSTFFIVCEYFADTPFIQACYSKEFYKYFEEIGEL